MTLSFNHHNLTSLSMLSKGMFVADFSMRGHMRDSSKVQMYRRMYRQHKNTIHPATAVASTGQWKERGLFTANYFWKNTIIIHELSTELYPYRFNDLFYFIVFFFPKMLSLWDSLQQECGLTVCLTCLLSKKIECFNKVSLLTRLSLRGTTSL